MARKSLTIDEVAARLGLDRGDVLAMIGAGRLHASLVDGELRVPEHEVAFILASGAVQGDERRRGRRRAAIRWPGATVDEIADSAATQYDVPKVNLEDYEIDPEVIALVPRAVVQRHAAIPVQRAGGFLIVAMADPANMAAIDDFKFITGLDVEPVVATATSIAKAIRRYYGSG